MQYVACAQGPSGMAAELAEREGATATQVGRAGQAACQQQVAAATGTLNITECERLSGAGVMNASAVEGGRYPTGCR
ncbi:hypothetical protein DZS_03150 [Dickeya ananatis]